MMINFRLYVVVSAVLIAAVSLILHHDQVSEIVGKLISALSFDQWTDGEKQELIDAWRKVITPPNETYSDILIGLNACLDLIVPFAAVFDDLNISAPAAPQDHPAIADEAQFAATFSEFFRRGHAAERHVADEALFDRLVRAASASPDAKRYIGGNAALMADIMAENFVGNTTVTLVAPVGPELARLMSARVRVPAGCRMARDEVHLILEFAVGAKFGPARAPIASRFIATRDEANARLALLPALREHWAAARPGLVVLAGAHMLEPLPRPDWDRVVAELREALAAAPRGPVHLELASMADPERARALANTVLPLVDSVGLNEQELHFLVRSLGGPHALAEEWGRRPPAVGEVADLLTWLLGRFADSRLSRVHLHSLTFHLLAARPGRWANGVAAVAQGARVASARACGLDAPRAGVADLRLPRVFRLSVTEPALPTAFVPVQGVLRWTRDGLDLAMAPVLVCRRPHRTVGLGDSVSSAGLMMSRLTE